MLGEPAAFALERELRWTAARAGAVLVYHRISDGPAVPSLVPTISRKAFADHLRHLKRRYSVVPANRILESVRERERGGPFPVAITFDDDLASHLDHAAPELAAAELPATFFLCGATLDGRGAFWWERLEWAARDIGLARVEARIGMSGDGTLRSLATAIEALPPGERQRITVELARAAPDEPESGMRAEDVRGLVTAGFNVGFHTTAHDRLTTLDEAELRSALVHGRERLEELSASTIDTLAYPHGWADARVIRATDEAGYRAAFTASGLGVGPTTDRLSIGRIEPSHLSTALFALRLSRSLVRARRGRERSTA